MSCSELHEQVITRPTIRDLYRVSLGAHIAHCIATNVQGYPQYLQVTNVKHIMQNIIETIHDHLMTVSLLPYDHLVH